MIYLEQEAVNAVRTLKFPLDAALLEGGSLSDRVIGSNMEFESYAPYVPGSDPRALDWKVLARSGRKVTKLYGSDLRSSVEVYLDTSRSMDYKTKSAVVRKLAAFILYFLSRHHRVKFFWINESFHDEGWVRSDQIETLMQKVRFGGTFKLPVLRPQRKTTRFLITDFWETNESLSLLLQNRFRIFHVLTPQEIDFNLKGYVNLIDSENGSRIQLSVAYYRELYAKEFESWQSDLQTLFFEKGLWYGLIRTDRSYYTEVIRLLKQGGGK